MKNYRLGKTLLAAVLAFSLALPTPALAFAAQEAGAALSAGSSEALQRPEAAGQAQDALQVQDVNADIWDGSIDTSWYDASASSFTLVKPAQLAGLAAIVNGTATTSAGTAIERDTFAGKTVTLGVDMQLNATAATTRDDAQRSWTPIGNVPLAYVDPNGAEGDMPHYTDGIFFDGTFDGAGHVVKNLYIYDNQPGSYGGVQGFFANVGGNALIQNVGIDGGYVYGRVAGGLVAISHVTEEGKLPHIIGCFNKANISCNGSSTRGAGGIFAGEEQYRGASDEEGVHYEANYHGGAYIANCYNWGTVSHVATSNCSMGGIAGTGSVQIFGCYNCGRVEPASIYSGSIAGNLIGAGYLVGQNGAGHPWQGASVVHDSYALSGSIPADERSLVKLYNLIDATHAKGGVAEQSPAITDDNSTDDVKFQMGSWFAADEAADALSQSFEPDASASYPVLYWQQGGVRWDINMKDSYGEPVFGITPIEEQTYTGSALEPALTVKYYYNYGSDAGYDDYVLLHEGSDYLVEYAHNTEIGQADVTMTGMGRFFNGRTVHFTIIDGSLDNASIDQIYAQWWYGSAVEPEVVVRSGSNVLVKDRDYQLEWTNNNPSTWTAPTKVGNVETAKASVTVKPLDDKFKGEKTASFTILKASTALDGVGSASDPKKIASKADLQFLAYKTHTGDELAAYSTYNYKVTADIDATSIDAEYKTDRPCDPLFTAWGTQTGNTYSFLYGLGATFDGGGHTITLGQTESGVSFDLSPALALIVYTKSNASPTIKDLTVDGSVLCPHGAAAGFAVMGQPGTITFDNCKNKAEVRGDAYYAGGAAGFIVQTSGSANSSLSMNKCVNEGPVTSGSGRAGGFVSALGGRSGSLSSTPPVYANTFTDCVNRAAVKGGQENGAGGFVAVLLGGDTTTEGVGRTTLFERCANEKNGLVTMTSSGDVGGIVGCSQDCIEKLVLDRCSNAATIDGSGSGAIGGGLVGRVYNSAEVTNSYNTGDVIMRGSMANNGAGLIGYFAAGNNSETSLLLQNVYATGTFSGPDESSGGLVGNIFLHTKITMDNAYFDSASAERWVHFDPRDEYPYAVSPPVVNGLATAMDTGAMKTETFASQLGVAFGPDDFNEPTNKGFPVLLASDRVVSDLSGPGVVMSVTPDPWLYTGAKIHPTVTVTTSTANLTEGTDFVVFYSTDGATGRAVVQGIGSYTGSIEKSFSITPCAITSCTISPLSSVSYADVAGLGATQDITVTNPAGNKMVEGIDYQVMYSQNDAAGIGYVRIEGLGPHYSGSALRMFTISQGDLSDPSQVSVENVDAHYPLSNGSGGLYIYEQLTSASGSKLKRADQPTDNGDYVRQFYYADGENAGQPVLTTGGNAATSLKQAGKYSVRFMGNGVRQLSDGSTQVWTNGNWRGTAEVTFTYGNRISVDADISGVSDAYGFTGAAIAVEPALVNKLTDYPLTKDLDYNLAYYYDNNGTWDEVSQVLFTGTYKLVISGANDWFGQEEISFEVVSPNYFINDSTVVEGVSGSYLYTGSAISPVPSAVKVSGTALDPATDYDVSYEDASGNALTALTEAGTYYVVVTGKGAYDGKKRVPFKIEAPQITVYVKQGAFGAAVKAKAFTEDEFKALKSSGDVVSALYCDQAGTNWKVASTDNYVTLADLLSAAGVKWGAGASVTYAGADERSGPSYTYEQVQELMFYPSTTATATDNFGGKQAPFVLSITDASSSISGLQSAHDVEAANVKNASSGNAPRAILGVPASSYINAKANAASMMGARLINHVVSVTVTQPEANQAPSASAAGVSMYRMYNPNSGEHFYTSSAAERNNLAAAGWDYEGIAWRAPKSSGTPVYRLYNPNSGDHHYTTSAAERNSLVNVGWRAEGTGWYSDDAKGTPMYRLYNPNAVTGSHHYTASASERDDLKRMGWRDEGIGWYGLK